MGGQFSPYRFMNCVLLRFFSFVSEGWETIARSIGLVCLFSLYSLVFSEANGLENLIRFVKFLIKISETLTLSFFLYRDLLRDKTGALE